MAVPPTETLPTSRENLAASLAKSTLPAAVVERLAEQAKSAIALATKPVALESLPIGASRVGGVPDLPEGMEWPTRPAYPDAEHRAAERDKEADRYETARPAWVTDEQARRFAAERRALARALGEAFPLAFIAQLDLAALSREPGFDPSLPKSGRLSLFFDYWEEPADSDPSSSVGFRLIWEDGAVDRLLRLEPPDALTRISTDDWTCVFKPASVTPRTVFTPIPPSAPAWNAFSFEGAGQDLYFAYNDWLSRFGYPDDEDGLDHQLGGWPCPLQNGMEKYAHLASNGIWCGTSESFKSDAARGSLPGAKDWRHVLQIGCDERLGLLSGSALYAQMREQDLTARAFERAWIAQQST